MSNGEVIEGRYKGCEVGSNEKGPFIDTNYISLMYIDETTAISADLKDSDPYKPVYGFSMSEGILNWGIKALILGGIGLMTSKVAFIFGLIIVILAVAFLIMHKPTPTRVGVYQVEITWKIGEKSLIECDSALCNKIQEAFN